MRSPPRVDETGSRDLLKTKAAGDIVGDFCEWLVPNPQEGWTYLAVKTDKAQDGIGSIRRDSVTPIS